MGGYSRAENKREKWWCNGNKWKGGEENGEEGKRERDSRLFREISISLWRVRYRQVYEKSEVERNPRPSEQWFSKLRSNRTSGRNNHSPRRSLLDSGLNLDCFDVVECVYRIFGYARANVDFDYRKKV